MAARLLKREQCFEPKSSPRGNSHTAFLQHLSPRALQSQPWASDAACGWSVCGCRTGRPV